jgi:Flp pilus assembly protein TadD
MFPLHLNHQSLFEQATALLARGEPRMALQLARQAWSLAPNNADVCNLVGVCAIALGDIGSAERCWQHAAALHPNAVEPRYNLAMLYADCRRLEDAERCYRQTLAVDPAHAGAHARLGVLLAGTDRTSEAEQCYRQALSLNQNDAATYGNLGLLLAAQKRDAQAEQCYRQALTLAPADSKVHSNLGILLARAKRVEEAEQSYCDAIALNPAGAETYTNLGLLLESCGRMGEAEQCQRSALHLNPSSSEIHSNLANLLTRLGRAQEAEQTYLQAIALNPHSAVAHSNLGVLLANATRDAEAEQSFRRAIALDADYQLARLNLAMLLLAQGRLSEGWIYHEARYHPDLPDPDAPLPAISFARWQGEPLRGKSLLVWPEQGLGDMIQFCRYLPLLKEQGATLITLVCRQALVSLMRTLAGVDTVLAIDGATVTAHDYWTLPMSLPLHCHTDLSTIPAPIPYLYVLPERRAAWSRRLPNGKFRVGLVWKGNSMHANDAKRSLSGLLALAPLWAVDGVQFVSLQYQSGADELRHHPAAQQVIDLGSGIGDFADTAAILEQLDLLITVDTAVAHLAGALGKRCWVLLPADRTDWRWMRARNDSPWYPDSMRLFRQAKGQDWESVIAEAALALREHRARPPHLR